MLESKLKPFVYKKMDILFVPLNPPEKSNTIGHYFSRTNLFWKILFENGLITRKVWEKHDWKTTADTLVFGGNSINYKNSIYGIHDLAPDMVENNSKNVDLSSNYLKEMVECITEREIKIVCIMHKMVFNEFKKIEKIKWVQPIHYGYIGDLNNTVIFWVPFPISFNKTKDNNWRSYSLLKDKLSESM